MDWQNILFIVAATVVLLLIARWINQLMMKESLTQALTNRDCAAVGVALAGYLFGVLLIITDVLSGEGHGDWIKDILQVGAYGVAGIFFLLFVGLYEMRLILSPKTLEAVRANNPAAGIALAGSYVATSHIIAATVSGEGSGGTWLTAMVFFVVGQLTLLLMTFVFRKLTAYDDTQSILDGNIPAAMSYAGMMVAIAIIVSEAIRGDFIDYETSLIDYAYSLIVVLALYPIRQILIQGLLLGAGFKLYGGKLDEEISRDRNIAAGFIEAVTYVGSALLAVRLF